jgi:hypothetical protein
MVQMILKPCFHWRIFNASDTLQSLLNLPWSLLVATQIGSFLLAKAIKEGDISDVLVYKLPMYMSLNRKIQPKKGNVLP